MKRSVPYSIVKWVFLLACSLVLAIMAFLAVFALKLSQGPVSLHFLAPYVQSALSGGEGQNKIDFQNLIVTWQGWNDPLLFQIINFHFLVEDHSFEVGAPKTSVKFDVKALKEGKISLISAILEDPVVSLVLHADSLSPAQEKENAEVPSGEPQTLILADVLNRLQARKKSLFHTIDEYMQSDFLRYLAMTEIQSGHIIVRDEASGLVWEGEHVSSKGVYGKNEISTTINGTFGVRGGKKAPAVLLSRVNGEAETLDLDFSLDNIYLADLGGLVEGDVFQAFALPFDLNLKASLRPQDKDDRLDFVLTGGRGRIDLEKLSGDPLVYPVSSMILRGSVLADGPRALIDTLVIDLGGPKIEAKLRSEKTEEGIRLVADAALHDVEAVALPRYWPPSVAPNPRAWITANIPKGIVREATSHFEGMLFPQSETPLRVDSVTGTMRVQGATVYYIKPMFPAEDVDADIIYDQDVMTIVSTKGRRGTLALEKGTIVLSGLSGRDQFADIDLLIGGSLAEGLAAVDEEPLRYASKFGIDAKQVQGKALVRLIITKMPLLANLKVQDLDIKAKVDISGGAFKKLVAGMDATDIDAHLDIDPFGMDVAGTAAAAGIPVAVKGHESFTDKADFDRRYEIEAKRITDPQLQALGLPMKTVSPYFRGPLGVKALVTMKGRTTTVNADLDFAESELNISQLHWRKNRSSVGNGSVTVILNGKTISSVPQFNIAAGGLAAKGSIIFEKGELRRLSLDALQIGRRTDVRGSVTFLDNDAYSFAIQGRSFDATPFLEGDDDRKESASGRKEPLPSMNGTVSLGRVWVAENRAIDNLEVSIQREFQDWRAVQVTGVAEGTPFTLSIQRAERGKRNFFASTQNLGSLIYVLSGVRRIAGGDAVLSGTIDDTKGTQPAQGTLIVKNYWVRDVPLLARILTVATLTGILDALQGEGISFSNLTAPFTLEDGLLTLKEAHTSGMSIGLTANGQIDFDNNRIAVEGTLAPAYAINGILDGVPILGDLLVFDRGGGVFASLYSLKGDLNNPDIGINALSTLTPGILRQLFNIFDDGSGTRARP